MPNNIIYLSQNAINNSNGTKNSFNGAEVAFAQAKGDNVAETNTSPLLDSEWLQSEIDRLDLDIEREMTDRLPRITRYLKEAIVKEKRLEYEINTGSLSMPFYCVSRVVNYEITDRSLRDRLEACGVCNNHPASSNMDSCMHYYDNLNGDGVRVYSLDITGGCSSNSIVGNGWNITEGIGACGGDGSFTDAEIAAKIQELTKILQRIETYISVLDELIKGVEKTKKKRAGLEMKLRTMTI